MESIVNPLGFGLLLTSLYLLRFRAWRRPATVVVYFVFFTGLEWIGAHYFIRPGALPPTIGYLCLFLTLPVLVATAIVWHQEQAQREGE